MYPQPCPIPVPAPIPIPPEKPRMRLEAVTVCVGYADFLEAVIPHNRPHFDKWVIVTTPEDSETRELCRRYGLTPVMTSDFYRDGAKFAKSRGIRRGIDFTHADTWILHIDGDVALPEHFRRALTMSHLDPRCLYGCDRIMARSWDQWQKLLRDGYLQHDYHCRVRFFPGADVGERWASEAHGYVPIGFFQLWHSTADLFKGARTRPYPVEHNDAARCDVQFALQWDRRDRILLPEIVAVHLESKSGIPLGANWSGRTTPRFGPPKT